MLITDVAIYLQLSFQEYVLLSIQRFSVTGTIKRLFGELQKPRQVNTIRKHNPIMTGV